MKYAIDKIENETAVLENIETREKIEVSTNLLPENIQESNILIYEDNKYILSKEDELTRKKDLLSKFNRLKKK